MSNVKIEIPVFAIILTGLLITAITVVITVIIIKNNQIEKITTKYDSIKIANQIIIKQKSDTIEYYKILTEQNDYLISNQKTLISTLNNKIYSIKPKVDKYTTNEVYDSINAYIEPKNDSLKFKLSGNQVKQIYSEHLELLESRSGMVEYGKLVKNMDSGIQLVNSQLNKQSELQVITQKLLSECENENLNLNNEVLKQQVKVKRNRILSPISFITGAIASTVLIFSVK
jgi:uncharacterized protein YuzB (UPF0349 family)